MGAIVAGNNTAPVLQAAEHILDPMALTERVLSQGISTFRLRVERMHGVNVARSTAGGLGRRR
jgi:hypothetical protein